MSQILLHSKPKGDKGVFIYSLTATYLSFFFRIRISLLSICFIEQVSKIIFIHLNIETFAQILGLLKVEISAVIGISAPELGLQKPWGEYCLY